MTEKEEKRLDKIGQSRIGERPRRSRRKQKNGGGLKRVLAVTAVVFLVAGILAGAYLGVQYWKASRIPEIPQESQTVITPETMGELPVRH